MKYNFDETANRRGTDSVKWNVRENELPMWVADMDFQTAPEIVNALRKRIDHGIFGYSFIPASWNDAYINWWKSRYSFTMESEWLVFSTGVIPAISSAVRKLTSVGEKILIQSPVYNIFYNSIINNGRHILENQLSYDGGNYSVDFDDLERKLADPQTSLMILCNPHNPIGKIWDKDTLARIGSLCKQNHVVVISDEIHCDLTDPGKKYIPFASVSEECRMNSVSCLAPTKTFNLAGLKTAAVMVPNRNLRDKMKRSLNTDEVAEPNSFALTAAEAAFSKGEEWLEELREYIYQNKTRVRSFIRERIPEIKVVPSEATYLLWLDCHQIAEDRGSLYRHIRKTTGLYLADGAHYGSGGEGFLRMNTACTRSCIEDGLSRLEKGVRSYVPVN